MAKFILTEWYGSGRLHIFSAIINNYYSSHYHRVPRYILPVFGIRSFVKAILAPRSQHQYILLPGIASGIYILLSAFISASFKYIHILFIPNWIQSSQLFGLFCGHDLAATICRIKPSPNPFPSKDIFLFYVLYRLYSNISYFSLVTKSHDIIFFPSHDIYWSRIRNRFIASDPGVKVVYCNSNRLSPYQIRYKRNSMTSWLDCYPESIKKTCISSEEILSSKKLIEERLSGKSKLPYILNSPYTSISLDTLTQKRFGDGPLKHTFVIFLHSFNDALFPFGFNGFVNTYEWARFIVKSLSTLYPKESYDLVIKPHPSLLNASSVVSNALRRDKTIFDNFISDITRSFPSSPFIIWNNSISELMHAYPQFIGLTLHGSVLVELLYLKIPVIFSSTHPYFRYMSSPSSWSTPSELYILLSTPCKLSEYIPPLEDLLNAYAITELPNPFRTKPDAVSKLCSLIFNKQLSRVEQSNYSDNIISTFNKSSPLQSSMNAYIEEILSYVL